MKTEREKQTQTETTEEEQDDALDSLMDKVDLFGPLEMRDHAGRIVEVSKENFMRYYLPRGTSEDDKFHTYQAVRATGLSLFAPGECYFFKTGDGPVKLFTGYLAYLRKAYAAGLEHIEKPEIEFADDPDGYPLSCTITIKIKDRDNMEWTTWFAEVAGSTSSGLNSRWKKAPIQMLIKCSLVNILRLSGLVDFTMPYTIDEMDDPVMDGYKTLTQEQAEGYELESAEATAGAVSADYHEDLHPLRKIYRGKLAEREIFVDDTQRKMWQSEIIGKASTSDWDAADFMKAVSEIESGRCEQWVEDNKPKPDPEPPAKSKTPEEATGGDANLEAMADMPPKPTFWAEVDKRFSNTGDLRAWCSESISQTPLDDWTDEQFETALPRLLELPLLATENYAELFITESAKRFLIEDDRNAWQSANLSTEETQTLAPQQRFALLLERVKKLPLLAAQDATGEPGQTEPQAEPEEEQGPPAVQASRGTLIRLSAVVKDFPGKKYMTVASKSFRARAEQTIKHEIAFVSDLTEQEALDIITSLQAEKAQKEEQEVDAEKFKEALETGEVVDDDPLNQGEPLEDGLLTPEDAKKEAESQASFQQEQDDWFDSPEYAQELNAYTVRAGKRFADVTKSTAFHQSIGLNGSPRFWEGDHFAQGNAMLDELDLADSTQPESNPTEDLADDEGKCTDEDFKELGDLFAILLPDKEYAMGSTEARVLIQKSKAVNGIFNRIKNLTADEVSDLKLYLNDLITDMKAEAEAKANA